MFSLQPEYDDILDYECTLYRCSDIREERVMSGNAPSDKPVTSRFVTLTLGVKKGPLLAAVVDGTRESITSQIATQLSFEGMLEGAFAASRGANGEVRPAQEIIQSAFREANHRVYDYGHRMAVGGAISAKAMVMVFDGKRVGVGQVGAYEVALWRDGKLIRFHDVPDKHYQTEQGQLQRFIGANSEILVDLAAVRVKDTDVIVALSVAPSEALFSRVNEILEKMISIDEACYRVAKEVSDRTNGDVRNDDPLVFMLQIGRPTITLREVVYPPPLEIPGRSGKA